MERGKSTLEVVGMTMKKLFNGIYSGKRVLITGHTGFKGSWLALWLCRMGAQVTGYSLEPSSNPNHFDLLKLPLRHVLGDITDSVHLDSVVAEGKPDIVFHLAAQPIVRASYGDPVGTYASNVMGTLNVCEAARKCSSVSALVAITTDKVYQNREWWWGYREADPLGGFDPYSASKACADILLSSYRDSFFNPSKFGASHHLLMAVARAGNVIGGGDWAQDRLIPDLARAASKKEPLVIRSPQSTRPWQHVLECLSGYLLTGQKLLEGNPESGTAFNFGPPIEEVLPVADIVQRARTWWPSAETRVESQGAGLHEARTLTLDCAKARSVLKWKPVWPLETALQRAIVWYRQFYETGRMGSDEDLSCYVADAVKEGVVWAS